MNIAIISPEYPPLTNWGGTATYNSSLAKVLHRIGLKVYVITYDGIGKTEREIESNGVKINYIKLAFSNKLLNLLYFDFPFGLIRNLLIKKIPKTVFSFEWNIFVFLAFRKLSKKYDIRVIHTPPYSFPALLISFFYKKILYVYHAQGAQREFNKFEPAAKDNKIISYVEDYYMSNAADIIVPCSNDTYYRIEKSFPQLKSKLVNIPNFSEIERFKFKQKINLDKIVFNGQLNYRKGVDILIKAFVGLANKDANLKLFLIGRNGFGFKHHGRSCDFNSWFNKQIILKDIKNRIFVLPQFDNQENLFVFLQTLGGIIVVPSRYEPFGYVTVEAMALYLPVLATNSGGSKQIITDGKTGFLFEPNPQSLKTAINKVRKMGENRISKILIDARDSVESRYAIKSVEKRFKNLYSTLIQKK